MSLPAQLRSVEQAEVYSKETRVAERYFLDTGKDFYELGPVEQRKLMEGE
jgi:hypothetical protein